MLGFQPPGGGGGSGDVTGPGSATDNAVARFDGTGGKTLQNSGIIVDDTDNVSGVGTLAAGVTTLTSVSLTANSNQVILDSDEASGYTTTVTATASASAKVVTLPNATDTLVGKATTDTFTNKTFDANGTGNSLSNVDVADLANGTDGELITWDAAGAPAVVAVGTATHVLTSNGVGVAPTFQAAAGGGGITWNEVTGTSQAAAVDNAYLTNNAGLVTVTIPTTAAVGEVVRVAGSGAGGWKIAQNASEIIHFGSTDTTTGTGGSLASTNRYDAVELVCNVANTEWVVISSVGNITIV